MSEPSHGQFPENFGSPEKLSFINYLQLFASISVNYLKQTGDKLIILTIIYSIFSLLAYFLYLLIKTYVGDERNESMKRVLIVTAHPDDECMFFGPTIVNLRSRNVPVTLLCLSPGDSAPNSRRVRKAELWESCKALGLDESCIELRKHSLLLDGHEHSWSHELIGEMILTHIETLRIDTVITFDESGVSEHPNHIAIFDAMAYLSLNHLLPSNVSFYSLDSVNRLRKYSFLLDFLTSFFMSQYCLILSLKQQYQVVKAMSCHHSQFVWFRKLYILFSRYTTINTLRTWTRDELKYCVKYQDLIHGMKYKNKWYESLDDSLKKINSEQVMSSAVQSDDISTEDFADTEDDESDANVSFKVKVSPSLPSSDPLEVGHPNVPTGPSTDTTSNTGTAEVAGHSRTRRHVSTPDESSPNAGVPATQPPHPVKLGLNESIHNGEIYVRKSRFLIPKTYGSFYNSSSSETSDDKEDGESSSSNTSLDKVGETVHGASSRVTSLRSTIEEGGGPLASGAGETPQTPSSVSSEEPSGRETDSPLNVVTTDTPSSEELPRTPGSGSSDDEAHLESNLAFEKTVSGKSEGQRSVEDSMEKSMCDDSTLEDAEEEEGYLSYEIEDIESVLEEFENENENGQSGGERSGHDRGKDTLEILSPNENDNEMPQRVCDVIENTRNEIVGIGAIDEVIGRVAKEAEERTRENSKAPVFVEHIGQEKPIDNIRKNDGQLIAKDNTEGKLSGGITFNQTIQQDIDENVDSKIDEFKQNFETHQEKSDNELVNDLIGIGQNSGRNNTSPEGILTSTHALEASKANSFLSNKRSEELGHAQEVQTNILEVLAESENIQTNTNGTEVYQTNRVSTEDNQELVHRTYKEQCNSSRNSVKHVLDDSIDRNVQSNDAIQIVETNIGTNDSQKQQIQGIQNKQTDSAQESVTNVLSDTNVGDSNIVDIRTNDTNAQMNIVSEQSDKPTSAKSQTNGPEDAKSVINTVEAPSSNSSEQESALDDQPSDTIITDSGGNKHSRNKKKRKNRRNKGKIETVQRITHSDDGNKDENVRDVEKGVERLGRVQNEVDSNELDNVNELLKRINDNNNTICDKRLGEYLDDLNKETAVNKDVTNQSKEVLKEVLINKDGAKQKDGKETFKDGAKQNKDGKETFKDVAKLSNEEGVKLARTNVVTATLGENDQNLFNVGHMQDEMSVELNGASTSVVLGDGNALLQPVSTN
ncbi:uncharacterized protein LOC103519896 [Diaphorina citri]|uniref:N-acetylglucosaminylphosphatidylinositol deacetylase n=1 Tax=Diaphorina citri TaxID=121845 RepID=A0A1S3DJK6_DIACI|nr:uncharacterized protein LOC103519896 [Diaphorina citri]